MTSSLKYCESSKQEHELLVDCRQKRCPSEEIFSGLLVEPGMKILMLGWEFPPFISGGLGTACHGLTWGMSQAGVEVIFVLPRSVVGQSSSQLQILSPDQIAQLSAGSSGSPEQLPNVTIQTVNAALA